MKTFESEKRESNRAS